jgi:hypothetical protein
MPVATAILPGGSDGTSPLIRSFATGLAINISITKHIEMIDIKKNMNASIIRCPNCCSKRNNKVSNVVSKTPHIKGNPNKRFNPIAVPSTSA